MHEDILTIRPRLSEEELANYWGLKRNTLQKWRCTGVGPVYIKLGAKIIYTREAIRAFEQSRTFQGSGLRILPNDGGNQ